MRTIGKTIWMAVGVAGFGVIAGIGLMLVGDLLGRRDESALRMAVPAAVRASSATAQQTPAPGVPSRAAQPAADAGSSPRFAEQESLPALKLVGTMLADDPNNSLAIFEDIEQQTRTTMRRGERIGSWALTTIERRWVLFTTPQGGEARLELDGDTLQAVVAAQQTSSVISLALTKLQELLGALSPEAAANAAQAITVVSSEERIVNRRQVLQTFEAHNGNPLQLLSQWHVVPHLDGAASGFQVTSVADSPLTEKAGLKVGDVVTSVNGKPVLDPRKLGEIANDFFTAPDVVLTLQRNGQPLTLHYQTESSLLPLMGQASP